MEPNEETGDRFIVQFGGESPLTARGIVQALEDWISSELQVTVSRDDVAHGSRPLDE